MGAEQSIGPSIAPRHDDPGVRIRGKTKSVAPVDRTDCGDFEKKDALTAFHVLFKLGQGGFGRVLLVRKKSNAELYALKTIDKNKIRPGDAQYVIAESEALQQMRHPFIMMMHGAFQDAGHFYFLFEFVGGGDLYEHVATHGTFSVAWSRTYAAEIALALEHIHSHSYMYAHSRTLLRRVD